MIRSHVTTGVGQCALYEREMPVPARTEVLIRPLFVGICGSDGSIIRGAHPYLNFPVVQGHEVVGTVIDIGFDVDAGLIGTTVVLDPTVPCRSCAACLTGVSNACLDLKVIGVHLDGGLSEVMRAPIANIHRIDDLPPRVGVFIEPLAVAMWAVSRGRVAATDRVIVLGAGAMGRSLVLALRNVGAQVGVLDRSTVRHRWAQMLGANEAWNFSDMAERVRSWGTTIVFDTTGAAEHIRTSVETVAPGGRVVVVGISSENLALPVSLLSRREIAVLGSRNSQGMFPASVAIARQYATELERTIEMEVPLDGAGDALRSMANRSVDGKIVVAVGGVSNGPLS